jgi:hypothetical protein
MENISGNFRFLDSPCKKGYIDKGNFILITAFYYMKSDVIKGIIVPLVRKDLWKEIFQIEYKM